MAFSLSSDSFRHNEEIPSQYTCEGKDLSPQLSWSDPPENTVCYALIVDDPDAPDPKAPKMTWVHWVLFNIPSSVRELPEGVTSDDLPQGTMEGVNDYHKLTYGGPCPPIGRHRYFFKLYALSKPIDTTRHLTKSELENAMSTSILARAELVGTYEKKQKRS